MPALLLDPLERVGLLFKSENRIDFAAAPHGAYRMTLADRISADHEIDIPA